MWSHVCLQVFVKIQDINNLTSLVKIAVSFYGLHLCLYTGHCWGPFEKEATWNYTTLTTWKDINTPVKHLRI